MTSVTAKSLIGKTRASTDVFDSLDVRLVVRGRLSPTAIDVHDDRAALAAVLSRPEPEDPRTPSTNADRSK